MSLLSSLKLRSRVRGLSLTPRCAATPLNWGNTVMRACWENDMSPKLLIYCRVPIYSSDYKHLDLSETHPQTHSITERVDTPLAAHCDVHTMDSLGRTRQRTNQTTMSGSAYPAELQYSCPANPLICKRKSQKIGYSSKEHLAAPETIVMVSLWPYMRKLVHVFWHIWPHKTTKSQVWLCHVTVCM